MITRKLLIFVVFAFLLLLVGGGRGFCSTPVMECTVEAFDALNLNDYQFIGGDYATRPIVFTSAAITDTIPILNPYTGEITGTITVPEHCEVQGTAWPEIDFAVRLPTTTWNGKLWHGGGSGYDGRIPETSAGLLKGYAAVSTNGGHNFPLPISPDVAKFAYNPPDNSNPNAAQKLIDFGGRAHQAGNLVARALIKAYYGSDPSRSYWVGCSGGGREGLLMAQRYPDLYDGFLVGSPVANFSGEGLRLVYNGQQFYGDNWLTQDKLPILGKAVYEKCDGLDGLVDGLIDDPRKCTFDPIKDLPACPGDVDDGKTCFTSGQMSALKNVYTGPHVSGPGGKFTNLELPLGSEYYVNNASGWNFFVWMPQNTLFTHGSSFVQYMAFDPPAGPDYDWRTFNFTNDEDTLKVVKSGIIEKIDAQDTNLWQLKLNGGKIIHYHGWTDTVVVPASSYKYYEAVQDIIGNAGTQDFYKLYMVPGMGHCSGALASTNMDDMFNHLVDWVENGVEPNALIASRPENGELAARTRPACPYPEVARYLGSGSIDDAANFTCVTLVPAQLDISQKKVKLGKGTFTAKMTIPTGYSFTNKSEITPVVSEGALGKITSLNKSTKKPRFTAKFNVADIIGIKAGDAVTFTVTAIFEQGGKTYAFEGSDTLKVLAK